MKSTFCLVVVNIHLLAMVQTINKQPLGERVWGVSIGASLKSTFYLVVVNIHLLAMAQAINKQPLGERVW